MRTRFDSFTLDATTRQLLHAGQPVHLSPKAFDVLSVLIEARPRVVNKHELHDRIWPGTFVVDANLSVLVGEIRRALGDNAQTPRFIRTVHKVGYAFCGDAADGVPSAPVSEGESSRCWLAWNDRRFMLSAGDNLIGRNPECAIWIDTNGVSRRHAVVRLDVYTGSATIEDLGSTNGTFVNEARVETPLMLNDGDVVQVASVPLTFRIWLPEKSRSTERIRRG